jgi:hypothetical protein
MIDTWEILCCYNQWINPTTTITPLYSSRKAMGELDSKIITMLMPYKLQYNISMHNWIKFMFLYWDSNSKPLEKMTSALTNSVTLPPISLIIFLSFKILTCFQKNNKDKILVYKIFNLISILNQSSFWNVTVTYVQDQQIWTILRPILSGIGTFIVVIYIKP